MTTSLLSTHAPGLSGALLKRWPTASPLLELAFTHYLEHHSLSEPEYLRSEGASFNPRPARFAQILLKHRSELTPELIAAAFLCAMRSIIHVTSPSELEKVSLLANQVRQAFIGGNDSMDLTAEQQALVLTEQVDTLRHLHMLREPQGRNNLADYRILLGKTHIENANLLTLRDAALERAGRFLRE